VAEEKGREKELEVQALYTQHNRRRRSCSSEAPARNCSLMAASPARFSYGGGRLEFGLDWSGFKEAGVLLEGVTRWQLPIPEREERIRGRR
jgi:hypothetical protein